MNELEGVLFGINQDRDTLSRVQDLDFSVHRNREGMSNWADDSPRSATDAMHRSLSGEYGKARSRNPSENPTQNRVSKGMLCLACRYCL